MGIIADQGFMKGQEFFIRSRDIRTMPSPICCQIRLIKLFWLASYMAGVRKRERDD
jgi:hypothetical protein